MTNNLNHIEAQDGLNPRLENIIRDTRIAWSESKEEIWQDLWQKIENNRKPAITRTVYMIVARYAAIAILTLLLGIAFAGYFTTVRVTTAPSAQKQEVLPDGSEVTVYGNSSLSYNKLAWKRVRKVKLAGEALFSVQKGGKFEVISNDGKTTVLGTQFIVFARENNYTVTCISGKVRLTEFSQQNKAIITHGQKAILQTDGTFEIQDLNKNINLKKEQPAQTVDEELKTIIAIPSGGLRSSKTINKLPAAGDAEKTEPIIPSDQNIKKDPMQQTRSVSYDNEKPATEEITGKEAENQSLNPVTENSPGSNNPVSNKFRSSLTPEQIGILENQKMTREQKRKAFMKSLSPEQLQLLNEQNQLRSRQSGPNAGENNASPENMEQQQGQMREQLRNQSGEQENQQQNQEQNKQQNQQNRENSRSASPMSTGSGKNE